MAEYVSMKPSTMLNPTPVVLVSCAEKGNPDNRDMVTVAWAGTVNQTVRIRRSDETPVRIRGCNSAKKQYFQEDAYHTFKLARSNRQLIFWR